MGKVWKISRSLYKMHWSPLGVSLYILIMMVVGWSVCEISST